MPASLDVLCIGHASFDVVFGVERHPAPDEKMIASAFTGCGGGPAANAAVAVARLGGAGAFVGYLGRDAFGQQHLAELEAEGVNTVGVVQGEAPTPLSAVLAKPDGRRALVNYRAETPPLPADAADLSHYRPAVVLLDGHEPALSERAVRHFRAQGVPIVLDAGSVHQGTERLAARVDYLVASERFAHDFTGEHDPALAADRLARHAPCAVVTCGPRGLTWRCGAAHGVLPAFPVEALDTTGAGDTFHGAFALALARGDAWPDVLRFASAAAALCCTRLGARPGLPSAAAVEDLLRRFPHS